MNARTRRVAAALALAIAAAACSAPEASVKPGINQDFLDPALDAYCELNGGEEAWYLKELTAETHDKVQMPMMIRTFRPSSLFSAAGTSPLQLPCRVKRLPTTAR